MCLSRELKLLSVTITADFSVPKLVQAVETLGDEWEQLRANLCVPNIEGLTHAHSLQEKLTVMFEYVLEMNPNASWRSVVQELDRMKKYEAADSIRPFIRPVSGESVNLELAYM